MTTSPFGAALEPEQPFTPGPFEAAALAGLPEAGQGAGDPTAPHPAVHSPFGPPSGALTDDPSGALDGSPFGAVLPASAATHRPTPPVPAVPAQRTASPPPAVPPTGPAPLERPADRGPVDRSGGRAAGRRPSPVVVVALAGGAVLAGALAAWSVLGSGDPAAESAVVVSAGTAVTAVPSADPTGPSAPAATAGTDPAVPAVDPAAGARDPFAPLVVPVVVGGGTTTDAVPVPTATPGSILTVGVGTGTGTGPGAGTSSSAGSSTAGGTTAARPAVTVTVAPTTPAALTRAQACAAVADPVTSVEQLLASAAAGTTGAVDAGTALRAPVSAMRAAVGTTSDPALASRLDIATSSAEALRAQLLTGTGPTADQVATQTSRDDDVRAACA